MPTVKEHSKAMSKQHTHFRNVCVCVCVCVCGCACVGACVNLYFEKLKSSSSVNNSVSKQTLVPPSTCIFSPDEDVLIQTFLESNFPFMQSWASVIQLCSCNCLYLVIRGGGMSQQVQHLRVGLVSSLLLLLCPSVPLSLSLSVPVSPSPSLLYLACFSIMLRGL